MVDDSHRNRRLARIALGKVGYKVITAADGFDALSKIVTYRPNIAFIETGLARLDGYQTCALIKNNADYCDIQVILLSGRTHPVDEARARLVGCDSQLPKPLTDQSLLAAVENQVLGNEGVNRSNTPGNLDSP